MSYFYLLCIAIGVSFLILLLVKKIFTQGGILDNPQKYGKQRLPVPYSMGIVFFLSFFLLSYFFVEHQYKLYLIWFFWWIITLVSFLDDRMNLSPKIRLCIQIFIGAVIWISAIKIGYISSIFWGGLDLERLSFEIFHHKIYLVSMVFTIVWYVFVFNSLNWTDGIPWNTSGLSLISFTILFFLWYILFHRDDYVGGIQNAQFIMKMAILLIGSLIPFWFFDVQEKILMGDSGTMFLAFMLATLAIIAGGKIATVLVVFGIYTVDAFYVILRRIYNKKSPLSWDYTHLHHRLLALWLTKNQVLGFVYFFSGVFWVSALFLDKTGKILIFWVIVFFVVFIDQFIYKIKCHVKK